MAAGDLARRVDVRSKDEIGTLASAFNAMAESRTTLESLRRNLVNDVAHELRTPLANLHGYLEVLRDGIATPTPEVIGILHDESVLLSRLVADLQELALAEAGKLPLSLEPVAISEPIVSAVDAFRPQAEAKSVVLTAGIPESLPEVTLDVARFGQILRNLLRNAIVHTPAGGSVDVRAEAAAGEVVVSIRDTGSGIAPEHLPFVFERFYRADPSRVRTTGGTGLGLAIVKHLVEAHHGRIEITSAVGAGTVVTVTLPIATVPGAS
jgi:signal transduction histidine kinase